MSLAAPPSALLHLTPPRLEGDWPEMTVLLAQPRERRRQERSWYSRRCGPLATLNPRRSAHGLEHPELSRRDRAQAGRSGGEGGARVTAFGYNTQRSVAS